MIPNSPQRHGIHYRLTVVLTKTPPDSKNAKKELGEELKIDPLALRRSFCWGREIACGVGGGMMPSAILKSQIGWGFMRAFILRRMSMNSAGKFH
jgi:hypothetical protein